MSEQPKIDPAVVEAGKRAVYEAIGRFIAEFSTIMFALEDDIITVLGGNTTQRFTRALLAEITAAPLLRAWRSVIFEAHKPPKDEQAAVDALADEVTQLIEVRNEIAHGAWLVGYGNEETKDWSEASLWKVRNSRDGIIFGSKTFGDSATATKIKAEATRAEVIANSIRTLGMFRTLSILPDPPKTKWSDRLKIDGTGKSRVVRVTNDGKNWRSSRP
jgi:hypothetical protein